MLSLPREIIAQIIDESHALGVYNTLMRLCRGMRALMPSAASIADNAPTQRRHIDVPGFAVHEWTLVNGTRHGVLSIRHERPVGDNCANDDAVFVRYDRGTPTDWRMVVFCVKLWGKIGSHINIIAAPSDSGYCMVCHFDRARLTASIDPERATISGWLGWLNGRAPRYFDATIAGPAGFYVDGTMRIDVVAEWLARWMDSVDIVLTPIEARQKKLPARWASCIERVVPQLSYAVHD